MKLREINKQPTIYGPHRFPSHVVNSFRQYANENTISGLDQVSFCCKKHLRVSFSTLADDITRRALFNENI
ncbi:UNVERIFIED_CONTAM: hypothetical protein NCL1_29987 [Trichonephila clavipes]